MGKGCWSKEAATDYRSATRACNQIGSLAKADSTVEIQMELIDKLQRMRHANPIPG